ncbi:DoxX family protein [Candidatus Nomurabacteria bacterium]|nr:DoxX family protein [Candidatus Nomurabacteria bacterium]USN94849.1 MAG: DoxX family protein [Candidatus Nomurabacteria bacterium]
MKYITSILATILLPKITSAHVGYVVPEGTLEVTKGNDFGFLFSALHNPTNLLMMLITILVVLVLYFAAHKSYFVGQKIDEMKKRIHSYGEFIPWILRLSLGIALMGAGAKGALISPLASAGETIAVIELFVGFFLLAGFMLLPMTIVACALFFSAIFQDFYIFGNIEFLAAAICLLILENPRPGIDDIIGLRRLSFQHLKPYISFILRVGIGSALIYLALFEKLLNPHFSETVVNLYNLQGVIDVSSAMWILSVAVIELVVGLFLLIGFQTRLTATIAFFVITTTFFYFKEDVYSHITLFGVLSVLFITGGGRYSVDRFLERLRNPEIEEISI